LAGYAIDSHRYFHEIEPLGIRNLSKIGIEKVRLYILVVRLDVDFIEEIMVLGYEFVDRT